MENNSEIPNEIKHFICNNKCFMNYTITCNPDGCYIVDKYAKEIMSNCDCYNSINAKSDTIKELQTENSKLKEENAALKKEKELLNKNLELSEELRNLSSEKKIIELQEDKKDLQYKIQKLEYDLTKQTQLNVYLVQLLREKEE